jgi:Holliday junction DNA helicase RuvA
MISYLEGKIILKKEKFIVLNVNNIGYKVFLSKKTISKLPETEKDIKFFCFQDVKEAALDLYGFFSYQELEFFEILNNIRGIGPKVAIEISSLGSLDDIKEKILNQDEKIFEGIPGIGKKRAMTIILELTGIIKEISKKPKYSAISLDEAEEGLINLGFARQQARTALSKVSKDVKEAEQRIKEALKFLGK